MIDAALSRYGAGLTTDGFITKNQKVTGVHADVRKGRLRMISGKDAVLASYPASRIDTGVADFVEKFWFWKPI